MSDSKAITDGNCFGKQMPPPQILKKTLESNHENMLMAPKLLLDGNGQCGRQYFGTTHLKAWGGIPMLPSVLHMVHPEPWAQLGSTFISLLILGKLFN